jgi:hypothetical protein
MNCAQTSFTSRRAVLAGAAAASVLVLPGCATLGGAGSLGMGEVLKRLLKTATGGALGKLMAPDGFWNSAVAKMPLPDLFGNRSGLVQGILTSTAFKDQLQKKLNNVAEAGAKRAAPIIADAVEKFTVADALSILKGGPTAATSALRGHMGSTLVNAMVPALGDALRIANDPLISQAISALSGVDVGAVAQSLSLSADNSIWYEIGASEADIRRNPEQTNDPLLIAALKTL